MVGIIGAKFPTEPEEEERTKILNFDPNPKTVFPHSDAMCDNLSLTRRTHTCIYGLRKKLITLRDHCHLGVGIL